MKDQSDEAKVLENKIAQLEAERRSLEMEIERQVAVSDELKGTLEALRSEDYEPATHDGKWFADVLVEPIAAQSLVRAAPPDLTKLVAQQVYKYRDNLRAPLTLDEVQAMARMQMALIANIAAVYGMPSDPETVIAVFTLALKHKKLLPIASPKSGEPYVLRRIEKTELEVVGCSVGKVILDYSFSERKIAPAVIAVTVEVLRQTNSWKRLTESIGRSATHLFSRGIQLVD